MVIGEDSDTTYVEDALDAIKNRQRHDSYEDQNGMEAAEEQVSSTGRLNMT